MTNPKSIYKGTGILILFLVLLVLLTLLFFIEEIGKYHPSKRPEKEIKENILTEKKKEYSCPVPSVIEKHSGKIAIIIDDVGWNPEIASRVKKFNIPLTLAILPDSPFGLRIAETLSERKNLDIILHIPLEPDENVGIETRLTQEFLTTHMTEEEIKQKVDDYLVRFGPYIKGVNHHMGSKFTADKKRMEVLLQEIKKKKLIYVDSLTSKKSMGHILAKEMGIPSLKRDIFIDNSPQHFDISNKLDEAAKIAAQKGLAVVIGHARTTTLNVLEEKIPELKKQGYQFSLISEVIKQ